MNKTARETAKNDLVLMQDSLFITRVALNLIYKS